jgi:LmbE family N-acetylglucosaminyl deacetylase
MMVSLHPDRLRHVVVLGAHCDDIVIGAGGSLLQWCRAREGLLVSALVLTGGGTVREKEEREALRACLPGAHLRVEVLDIPDGRVPAHWERAKGALQALAAELAGRAGTPDLVLAPARHDGHQDHRELGALAPTAFRDDAVLHYEIIKYDSDLAQPSVFVPLRDSVVAEKTRLLARCYPSQLAHDWFCEDVFTGLARLRGVQCHARYAEAFHSDKLVLSLEGR